MSTLLRQLKGESRRYTKMDSHGLGKLLDSAAERIAELENHIQSLKCINEYIDEGYPDINVIRSEIGEVISRAEGTYVEALKEQVK